MVPGLPQLQLPSEMCVDYLESKQPRGSFKHQVATRSKDKLEIIYSNVYGPIVPETLGGNKYFVTFVDDFSRKNMGL